MRREEKREKRRFLAGCLFLAVLCLIVLWITHELYHEESGDTATPNDWFAIRAGTSLNEEAEEAMLLKIACLTFDDGPSKNTEPILEILQQYDVPATFFVTAQGVNQEYLPLVAEIAAQGHQIALHSASHEYSKIYQSTEAFWLDIKELRQALSPYINVEEIHWLRFPGGSTNTVSQRYGGSGIMKELIAQAEEKGYEWIDWNVSAEDATSSHPSASRILKNIRSDAAGRDICVVLMHDTKATGQTVKALPEVIEWFQSEGYHFLTVQEMYDARGQ